MEKTETIIYNIKTTSLFYQKLDRIKCYYDEKFHNEKLIEFLYEEIDQCVEILKIFPYINAPTIILENSKFYRSIVHNYVIIYEIDEERKEVVLINIYHHLEDYLSYYV